MNTNLFVGLINNSALLMALIVIYEFSYLLNDRWKRSAAIINGLLIGLIGLAIMSVPLHLKSGILFDTRSILLPECRWLPASVAAAAEPPLRSLRAPAAFFP